MNTQVCSDGNTAPPKGSAPAGNPDTSVQDPTYPTPLPWGTLEAPSQEKQEDPRKLLFRG